jgi:hypothetical protein
MLIGNLPLLASRARPFDSSAESPAGRHQASKVTRRCEQRCDREATSSMIGADAGTHIADRKEQLDGIEEGMLPPSNGGC